MKYGVRGICLGVAIVLCLTVTVWGAGISAGGVGAKAKSMGGAFRAIADDWSAAYWNPAGLAQLEESELDFTFLVVNPRPTFTPVTVHEVIGTGYNMKGGGERYPEDRLIPFPSFSGFVKVPSLEKVTFGAAVYWVHDANFLWDLYQIPDGYNETRSLSESDYRLDLDVWDFHPTVALEVNDRLSLGAGLSVQRGDMVFKRIHLFENDWGTPWNVYPFENFVGELDFDGNGTGIGVNGGLTYKASDKLTVALTGQSPVEISLEGTSNINIIYPKNDALGAPGRDTTYQAFYQGGFESDRSPFQMDLKLPGSLGLGVAYQVDEQLTFAADVAVNFWSEMEEWRFEFGEGGHELNTKGLAPITKLVMPMDYEDQVSLGVGFQYIARENLILRGGYSFDQTAVPDETFRPYIPDYGSQHGVNGGVSWLLKAFEISAQAKAAFAPTRTIETLRDVNGDGQFDNFPGEYTANQFELLLSTKYRF